MIRAGMVCALALVVCLTTGACGSSGPEASPGARPTTTTAASDGAPPSVRVVLGGDSVMASLVPAVRAALGDQAQVDYLAAPTISTASDRAAWEAGIEEHDPDLVVVLVGPWEVLQPGFAPTETGWPATYADEVLDPLVASLTAGGARVLWVEMHSSTKVATTLSFAVLGAQARALAEREEAVDVIDAGAFVDHPDGTLADVLRAADGAPERIRRLDGTGVHLCPAGVVRLATPVLDWLTDHADEPVSLVPGWEGAAWRWPPELEHPEQCPPASDPARSTGAP
ncbi:MAG: hypothetical protein JNK12_09490 [Acidimicrobiales bacterium]|nr:hypothetical protein [Acidimicrobiales bacterium]